MTGPAASIVIPTYRHRDFIREAIDSVFAQTFTDHEIIVINDGSPDDTAQVLRPLVEDKRIRYIEQPNAGQAAARNRGIAEARGEFIALLDDDDLWPPDHLEWQVEALRASPAAVMVYGVHQKSDAHLPEEPSDPPSPTQGVDDFVKSCPLISPGQALFRRWAIQRAGGLDADIWGSDDWDLYLRLARMGPILYQNRLALIYRVHEGNASKNYWRMYRNARKVVDKHFPRGHRHRKVAMAFARQFSSQIGVNRVLLLRQQRDWVGAAAALAVVIYIKPGRLHPAGLWRRIGLLFHRT